MNHYLGHLAQRAVSQEAAIQPRPVSLFSSYASSGYLGAVPGWDWSSLFDEETWQELDTETPAELAPSSQVAYQNISVAQETFSPLKTDTVHTIVVENFEQVQSAAPAPEAVMAVAKEMIRPHVFTGVASREIDADRHERAPEAVPSSVAITRDEKIMLQSQIFATPSLREPLVTAEVSAATAFPPPLTTASEKVRNAPIPRLNTSPENRAAQSPAYIIAAHREARSMRDDALSSVQETGVPLLRTETREMQEPDFIIRGTNGRNAEIKPSARPTVTAKQSPTEHPKTAIENIIRPYVEAAQASLQNTPSPQSPPAAPTIRVNIGRIEVRAVTPPAPSPRPKRAANGPRLSLEEYLKQRNGGGR